MIGRKVYRPKKTAGNAAKAPKTRKRTVGEKKAAQVERARMIRYIETQIQLHAANNYDNDEFIDEAENLADELNLNRKQLWNWERTKLILDNIVRDLKKKADVRRDRLLKRATPEEKERVERRRYRDDDDIF